MFEKGKLIGKFTSKTKLEKRFLIDILSVAEGIRHYGLLHIPKILESGVIDFLNSLELKAIDKRYLYQEEDKDSRDSILRDTNDISQSNFVEIWFSKISTAEKPNSQELYSKTGKYLGYPTCCIHAWEKSNEQKKFYQQYLYEDINRYWQINRLASIFQDKLLIPDFFPCSLHCTHALKFADLNFSIAEKYFDDEWIEDAKKSLQAILLFYNSELFFFKDWVVINHELNLDLTSCKKVPTNTIANFIKSQMEQPKYIYILKYDHINSFTKVNFLKNNKVIISDANFIYK